MLRSAFALILIAALAIGLVAVSTPATAAVRLLDSNINWTSDGTMVRFQLRFDNPDPEPTPAGSGEIYSQELGAFLPDYGSIGHFDLPSIGPLSFFDVWWDMPLSQLPPSALEVVPGGDQGGPCPPELHWSGNVRIVWSAGTQQGQVFKHHGKIKVCPGDGCSWIRVKTGCSAPAAWIIGALCPGFNVQLFDPDMSTPAANPVPPGWQGFICVTANAGVPMLQTCCFKVKFNCGGQTAAVKICATTCDCNPNGAGPVPGQIGWTTPIPGLVRFHVRWDNPSSTAPTTSISGDLRSQVFGVFQPDAGPIGSFSVPSIDPNSFFDVFTDVSLSQLPPAPTRVVPGGGTSGPCPPGDHWDGNVDIVWGGPTSTGQVNRHLGELKVCPGAGASLIHIPVLGCASDMPWSVIDLCTGFSATLVNEDKTPAPNPVPAGWSGYISVTAAPGTAVPDTCCFKVKFECDGVPATVQLCAITCNCQPTGMNPVPGPIGWSTLPDGHTVRFHVRWSNPSHTEVTLPVSGDLLSQEFGVFLPDFGPIGHFDVPAIMPDSFFDVFFDVPLSQLPPSPGRRVPGGEPGGPCTPGNHWDGNVDLVWTGSGGSGEVHKHYGELRVCPGSAGMSLIHISSLNCTLPPGMPWTVSGVCPGFTVNLVNESLMPAPNPVPLGWTGYIGVSAASGTVVPDTCCFQLTFLCGGVPGVIDLCAITCDCAHSDVGPSATGLSFAIRSVSPNPTAGSTAVRFVLPAAQRAKLEVYDVSGRRISTLVDESFGAGEHTTQWNGRDARGNRASPGIYFVRLTAAGKTTSVKLVIHR